MPEEQGSMMYMYMYIHVPNVWYVVLYYYIYMYMHCTLQGNVCNMYTLYTAGERV